MKIHIRHMIAIVAVLGVCLRILVRAMIVAPLILSHYKLEQRYTIGARELERGQRFVSSRGGPSPKLQQYILESHRLSKHHSRMKTMFLKSLACFWDPVPPAEAPNFELLPPPRAPIAEPMR
jgi:hypothetical protein